MVIDEVKQLVRATHLDADMLTIDDVKRFNADLAKLAAVAATRFGKIRLLADTRKLPIQKPEVVQVFDTPEQLLRTPEDRYAVVVQSSLAKLASRRVLGDDDRMCTFFSPDAAELWLLDGRMSAEDAEAATNRA